MSQFPLIHVQGWSDIKYICGTIGHEITEGIADIDTLHSGGTIGDFEGRTIKEPFSNPTGNNELCDYCNKFGAENQTGGSGIGGQGAPQGGFLQHYTGIATYSNGAYGCTYWDDNSGGCRAPDSTDSIKTALLCQCSCLQVDQYVDR